MKLVTSTTLLIERRPIDSRRVRSQSGLGSIVTPRTTRAAKRGHPSASSMATRTASPTGSGPSAGEAGGRRRGAPRITEISRASPKWFMQSGRLVVMSTSSTVSSPWARIPSTARPAAVSARASSWASAGREMYSASQASENSIG
jgi:hypothetical protein